MGSFNPMRWDCKVKGCFNVKQRPKIELFHDCFPGKISFGDIDAIVEINGKALMLEWKSVPMVLAGGQRIMHERLTAGGMISVLCVAGDAEHMTVTHKGVFYKGRWTGWNECSFEELRVSIKKWVEWAKTPRPQSRAA